MKLLIFIAPYILYTSQHTLGIAFETVEHFMMFTFLRKYFSPFVRQDEELSLLQIFKPLYFLLSVIGLFPRSIAFPRGKRNITVALKSTKINLACTLLMTLNICVFFCLHMLEINVASRDNTFTKDKATFTNYISSLVLMLLFSLITYICAFKNRSLYIKILNEIADCWANLPNSNSKVILGPLRVQVNCMVLGSLLLMLIVQSVITFTEGISRYKIALIAMTFNLPEMLQFTLLAFYFVMIVMIVALLKNIEEHFATIVLMRIRNDCVGLKLGSSLASLRKLRSAYARAMAVKRKVNAAFQAPLLLLLAQGFQSLVCNAHALYHGVTFQDDFTRHNVVDECFWIFYQLIKFHILGYSSALLILQSNKIGRTLYDISAHTNEETTQFSVDINEEITLHLEIQHFASLMVFQDTEITICGLFPLRPSLLFNVVASAAMYLVILVQFDTGK